MSESGKEEAIRRAREFYRELERLVKRYDPKAFGVAVSSLLHRVMRDPNQWTYYPPHMLVNAIEANCAYFRGHRDNPVTKAHIDEILNHYKAFYDPYLQYALEREKSLDLLALAVSRQQFDLQRNPSRNDLARTLLLYVVNDSLSRTSVAFKDKTTCTLHDWAYMCLAIYAHVNSQSKPLIRPDNYVSSRIESIPREAVNPFFQMASLSPVNFGETWRSKRKDFPPHLHIFLRSVFFGHPLIAYDDGTYLVVHPNLIFYHGDEGLYQNCLAAAPNTFYQEFSQSFEKYVGSLLESFFPRPKILTESVIQSHSPGRSCDFLVDHPNCLLLVECKATKYSSDLLTENAVQNDNSTGKVAEAFEQIYETARRVAMGELDDLVDREGKSLVGIVVTYGELHFVNSPFYFETFISRRMAQEVFQDWPGYLVHPPQVMKVDTLEGFLVVMRERGLSPLELIGEKLSLSYEHTGDWPQYIQSHAAHVQDWTIPALESAANEFFRDILGDKWHGSED